MKSSIYFQAFFGLLLLNILSVGNVKAQSSDICGCWAVENNKVLPKTSSCFNNDLSEAETLKIMECLLKQKGNKSSYWGIAVNNNVSQTFGSSSIEVVALFQISYLFYGNKDFASAIVLVDDNDDENLNTEKSVNIAYTSYRKWFKKVKEIGLEEARKLKLDPLDSSGVGWY